MVKVRDNDNEKMEISTELNTKNRLVKYKRYETSK